jgi:hypothetical protein
MPVAEPQDAFVIGDERAAELDRCRDQQPIGGIVVLEVVKLITAGRRAMAEGRRLDAGTL